MRLPNELNNIVIRYAWPLPADWVSTNRYLRDQLDCAIDCQENIPPWFLNDIDYAHLDGRPLLPFTRIRSFNPLVFGACYSPFSYARLKLNRRSVTWFINSLTLEYLRRKNMLRKPLYRLLDKPALDVWNRLLDKLGDVTVRDICPKGYLVSLITHAMTAHLPCAGRVGNWKKRFSP